jgi:hypothetical protein
MWKKIRGLNTFLNALYRLNGYEEGRGLSIIKRCTAFDTTLAGSSCWANIHLTPASSLD